MDLNAADDSSNPTDRSGAETGSVGDRSQVEVEEHLAEGGFDAQFGAFPEGESDPSDMAVVVPVTCPHCGAAGTLSLQFGPMASIEESDVLAAMPRTATAIDPRSGGAA